MKRKALSKGQGYEIRWDDAYADSRKRSGLKDIGAAITSRGILEKNHPKYIILIEHESEVPERTAKFAFPGNKDIFLAIPWGCVCSLKPIPLPKGGLNMASRQRRRLTTSTEEKTRPHD